MIQSGAQVFDNFGRVNAPTYRKALYQRDFVDDVFPVRLRLRDISKWLLIEETIDISDKLIEQFVRPTDSSV